MFNGTIFFYLIEFLKKDCVVISTNYFMFKINTINVKEKKMFTFYDECDNN